MCAAQSDFTLETADQGASLSMALLPDRALVARMLDGIEKFLSQSRVDVTLTKKVMLAVEELVVNAIMHGRIPDVRLPIDVKIHRTRDEIVTKITYQGDEFDPTGATQQPADRFEAPGGFGLELVRKIVDTFSYQRHGKLNIITLSHIAPR